MDYMKIKLQNNNNHHHFLSINCCAKHRSRYFPYLLRLHITLKCGPYFHLTDAISFQYASEMLSKQLKVTQLWVAELTFQPTECLHLKHPGKIHGPETDVKHMQRQGLEWKPQPGEDPVWLFWAPPKRISVSAIRCKGCNSLNFGTTESWDQTLAVRLVAVWSWRDLCLF